MSRFRAYRAKDQKWYVVTTDTNGLAGGPYNDPAEAQARADRLAALEAAAALAAKQAKPEHRMNITKGYRSPNVEDARGEPPPNHPGPEFYPPWFQRNMEWGGVRKGELPPPDWGKPKVHHRIPIDPNDPSPEWEMDGSGDWRIKPGTENRTHGEAQRFEEEQKAYWKKMAEPPQVVGLDLRTREFVYDKSLADHVMAKQAQQREAARGAQPPWSTPPPTPAPPKKKP